MYTKISNNIIINDPTVEVTAWIRENLIIDNPVYIQLKRLGKEDTIKLKRVEPKLKVYATRGNELVLPFGVLYSIWPLIKDYPYDFKFNNNGQISIVSGVSDMNPYDYQEKAINAMISAKGGVLVSPCGSGKGLPLDTKVYTPNGWKRNGDLKVGDKVIGSNGKPTTVTHIFDRGEVDAYKITFSDNTSIICDKDHLWNVQSQDQRTSSKNWKTISTEKIFEHYENIIKRGHDFFIPIVEPVEFEKRDVILEPWLLGILLSDGCFHKGRTFLSNSEKDIIEKANRFNIKYSSEEIKKKQNKHEYVFCKEIMFKIRELGLESHKSYEKYIPKEYIYNDIETRLSVLQGLFDGDGNVNNKKLYEYSTSSKQLALDIIEIVQSLGGTAKMSERIPRYTYKGEKKQGRKNYRIFFKLYNFLPFTSEKHTSNFEKREKYVSPYRKIKSIEPVEPITSRCIKVDAEDELYVIENFIVTHNTFMGIELIKRLGKKTLWLCHTGDLLRQAHDDFKKMYPNVKIGLTTQGKLEIGRDVTISTIQTMDKIDPDLYRDQFDVVICDECAHVAGSPTQMKMFSRILSHIHARYKYGLTATPSRSDGTIKTMYAYIGCSPRGLFEPTYIVPSDCVKKIECVHKGVELNMGYNTVKRHLIYDSAGMLEFNRLINALSEDNERNHIICNNIESCWKEGRKQVVLCHRVSHCEALVDELNSRGIKTVICTGKTADKKRKQILNLEVEWDVLVATYSLLKEGISINELDTLHMVTPVADKAITVQCAGRIERYMEDKKQPIAFDYVDMDVPYCRKKFTDRKRFLKRR